MLSKIEQFFRDHLTVTETQQPKDLERNLMIATTVLFLEIAYADFSLSSEEEKHIQHTLEDLFILSADHIKDLIELARESRTNKNDIWTFASLIKENFSKDQKKRILEKLWLLIYADGNVDKYEDRLIRKITLLLGLEHSDMIAAKLEAKHKLKK